MSVFIGIIWNNSYWSYWRISVPDLNLWFNWAQQKHIPWAQWLKQARSGNLRGFRKSHQLTTYSLCLLLFKLISALDPVSQLLTFTSLFLRLWSWDLLLVSSTTVFWLLLRTGLEHLWIKDHGSGPCSFLPVWRTASINTGGVEEGVYTGGRKDRVGCSEIMQDLKSNGLRNITV